MMSAKLSSVKMASVGTLSSAKFASKEARSATGVRAIAMRIPFISRFMSSDEGEPDPKLGSQRNVQHNPADIQRLLEQYRTANHLLTAQFYEGKRPAKQKGTTGIIAVLPDEKVFVIDNMAPKKMNSDLEPNTSIHFSLTHLGIRCQFDATYIRSDGSDAGPVHLFKFPKGIEHIQLRDAFRIKVSNAHPVKAILEHEENPTTACVIADLSASGARLKMDGLIDPQPNRGDVYKRCKVILPDGNRVQIQAQLMHWEYFPETRHTFIGIKFLNIDSNAQRTLNRYITNIQRRERQVVDRSRSL